jgi:hypothetical protein
MIANIPDSAYARYQTTNSLLENTSVKWLDYLFNREGIKANFKTEDKNPDIDGTFEILENSRFNGRLEVQIKTYNAKASRNKPQYSCDTKVLYYALKNRVSCVLLFVVDSKNKRAHWKYLSKSFIEGLNLREKQKTITIKFNGDEYVDDYNFNQCAAKWLGYYSTKNNGIFFEDCDSEEAGKKGVQLLKHLENIDFSTLNKEDVVCIQKFIDRFNYLLDGDYNFIKRFYYPNMWKMGIAIGTFTSTSLVYVLYYVLWGSTDLIIKKINLDTLSWWNYTNQGNCLLASSNDSSNPIIDNTTDIIMKYINRNIKDLLENKKFLFLSPEIATEYIYDTLKEKYSSWKIDYTNTIDLITLKEIFESKYDTQMRTKSLPIYTRGQSNTSTFHYCIEYLLNNDFKEISRLYPVKPTRKGDSYFNYLFAKIQVVFSLLPDLFDAYIYYTFPSLKSKITFWDGVDLLSVNLMVYDNGESSIEIFHFNRIDNIVVKPIIIFTENFKHELYSQYHKEDNKDLSIFEIIYPFNGAAYKLITQEFTYLNLNGKYVIHEELYKYLGKRFDDYLRPDCRIKWSDLGSRF